MIINELLVTNIRLLPKLIIKTQVKIFFLKTSSKLKRKESKRWSRYVHKCHVKVAQKPKDMRLTSYSKNQLATVLVDGGSTS